jgi:hypothetical protein
MVLHSCKSTELASGQGVTKGCRLSWLTNSDLVYEPKCGGGGGVAGSQPMRTAEHRNPNKLWRSNSIFNLRIGGLIQKEVISNLKGGNRFLSKEIW